ncbi:MAG: TrmH family RNA methyltransferase [Phycisphaerales bacterium]
MPSIERATNLDDPRVALFRETRDGDALRRAGVFLGEGMLVLERLLAPDARFAMRSVLVDERRLDDTLERMERSACARDLPVFVADAETIESLIGFRFHQGVLVLGERGTERNARDVVRGIDLAPGGPSTLVVLENLVDHDNIGSAFRNAAGFGASGVLLSASCADPLYRKSVRTSMGHALRVPFGRFGEKDWPKGLESLRERGFAVAALTPADDARDIDEFARGLPSDRRLALLVGSEGPGLSARAMRAADARVSIPMAANADSINVAAALAVALHATRAR